MRGFTLTELIVVIAIFGILSSIILVSYRGGSENIAASQSAQSIAQSIRAAQNKALGGACAAAPCRFGVHFDDSQSSLLIFEDGSVSFNGQYDAGEEIETVVFEENISIVSLSDAYACGVNLCADVLFAPPDPAVSFMPAAASSLVITTTDTRSVTVGSGGSVDID